MKWQPDYLNWFLVWSSELSYLQSWELPIHGIMQLWENMWKLFVHMMLRIRLIPNTFFIGDSLVVKVKKITRSWKLLDIIRREINYDLFRSWDWVLWNTIRHPLVPRLEHYQHRTAPLKQKCTIYRGHIFHTHHCPSLHWSRLIVIDRHFNTGLGQKFPMHIPQFILVEVAWAVMHTGKFWPLNRVH